MSHQGSTPRRFRTLLLVPALALIGLLGAALYHVGAVARAPEFHGTAYDPPAAAAEFSLTDHTGRQVRLQDFRGSTVLLFFGYAHCPDVCPLTLSKLHRLLEPLDVDPDRVRVLLVTVDPERDTPEALARYVARFGPEVTGLTGSPRELRRVAAAYGVHAQPAAGEHRMVSHTSAVFGIDRQGRLRVLLRPDNPDAELAADLRALLEL